jgi:lipopolysaccharide transport system ATP-binding protein
MSSDSSPAVRIVDLTKSYHVGLQKRRRDDMLVSRLFGGVGRLIRRGPSLESSLHWALRDISLEIEQGDVVALIGNNGAGKSTLLKILARITEPTSGYAELRGRVGSLLEVGTGFHPELTGRENVFLSGAILGMRRAEIARDFDEIVAFAEVEKFIDTPIKHYSSGMHVRLAFAVATQLRPEILLIDEVLAVGDARFQRKCLQRIREVGTGSRTIIFVSHNMAAVRSICKKGVVLEQGRIVAQGEVGEVVDSYLARTNVADAETAGHETTSFRIDRVSIAPADGLVIKTFEAIEIRASLTAKLDMTAPSLVIKLLTANHERITGLNFANYSAVGPMSANEQREVGFAVEALPLLPGTYFLELELRPTTKEREHVSTLFPFEVAVTPVFDGPRPGLSTRDGCVVLRARAIGGRSD